MGNAFVQLNRGVSPARRTIVLQVWETHQSSYAGNLTIVLDQDARFTLSNDIIIRPREYMGAAGAFKTDPSVPGILVTPLYGGNAKDLPHVGRPFFSAVYVMVDLDRETWTIWQANATTDMRLVSIGNECPEEAPEPPGSGQNAPGEMSTADRMEPDTIAGTVVGSVFGISLLIGLAAVYWLRRKRSHIRHSATDVDTLLARCGREPEPRTQVLHEKFEVPAQGSPSFDVHSDELAIHGHVPRELHGHYHELPAEAPLTPHP